MQTARQLCRRLGLCMLVLVDMPHRGQAAGCLGLTSGDCTLELRWVSRVLWSAPHSMRARGGVSRRLSWAWASVQAGVACSPG